MALLDNIRNDLGLSDTDQDSKISIAIESAKQKLSLVGVNQIYEDDPLTKQAIMLYCRYWFNYQGDKDAHLKAFKETADAMATSEKYGESYE